MKKTLRSGALAVALAAAGIFATNVSAQQASRTWSVAVHIEYADGFVYDNAFVTGVPASELQTYLQACGSSHRWGSAVRFHCYPIPE